MSHSKRLSVAVLSIAFAGPTVIASGAAAKTPAAASSCNGITFTVLHNDRSGGLTLPAGQYRVSSSTLPCTTASHYFTRFLDKYTGAIPGWTGKMYSPGNGKYSRRNSNQSFTVKLVKKKK
ncbi:MAG: hypothetical protein WAL63_08345 [Solirubrobacteraceae bacterium]